MLHIALISMSHDLRVSSLAPLTCCKKRIAPIKLKLTLIHCSEEKNEAGTHKAVVTCHDLWLCDPMQALRLICDADLVCNEVKYSYIWQAFIEMNQEWSMLDEMYQVSYYIKKFPVSIV